MRPASFLTTAFSKTLLTMPCLGTLELKFLTFAMMKAPCFANISFCWPEQPLYTKVSPVAATNNVTARENTSVSIVAHDFGSFRTATDNSSGAVYSVVTADKVFGTIVLLSSRWLDEKSMNKGVNGNSSWAGLRIGRRRMLPGLMSPCTIEASLCIQSRALTSFEARLSQTFVLPRAGNFMLDVVLDDSAIIAHDLI